MPSTTASAAARVRAYAHRGGIREVGRAGGGRACLRACIIRIDLLYRSLFPLDVLALAKLLLDGLTIICFEFDENK